MAQSHLCLANRKKCTKRAHKVVFNDCNNFKRDISTFREKIPKIFESTQSVGLNETMLSITDSLTLKCHFMVDIKQRARCLSYFSLDSEQEKVRQGEG